MPRAGESFRDRKDLRVVVGRATSVDRMEEQPRVVVVEDDPTVRQAVGAYLRANGYEVAAFGDGLSARAALADELPDVLIVDRMLPGISGDELCREVRATSEVPIMMLTALGQVEDRIEGLETGVDDYLAKPFSLRELLLRVGALVRRARAAQAGGEVVVGAFRIDVARRRVWVRGDEVTLTAREYDLLAFLVRAPDRVVARDEILREVWGWSIGEASTVTVHVRRLREKIEIDPQDPRHLHTEWGAGYSFSPQGRLR